MVNELRLFRFVDGVNDTPFPNKEVNDEQIVITSFAYNAQRMAVTPTITASIDYSRCLDNDWDVNVYAEYKGEKYYIRQIPSSSKSNTSVMYKHDLTLYSERFILENIYFTDIEKKTENGVDVFVKRETTSIIYRFNLIEYVERLNWSLETSGLPYRVYIDSSIENSEKAKETKDIALEHAYLSNAIQEIYNQWEIPFYFEGNNIIVKDCSENINDVVLEYGAENSLLSIKKNNANFRKITRISGYGSDKNIPFYYPNWSQKGVIDAMPLSTNSKLTKSMITITDMKKFDKKMPLNGKVKYKLADNYENEFSYNKNWSAKNSVTTLGSYVQQFPFHTNAPYGFIEVTIPIVIKQTFEIGIASKYYDSGWKEESVDIAYSWSEIAKRCAANFDIKNAQFATFAMQTVINASITEDIPSETSVNVFNDTTIGRRRVEVWKNCLYTFTALTSSTDKVKTIYEDFPRAYSVYIFPQTSINDNVQKGIDYGSITIKDNSGTVITKRVIAKTMGDMSITIGYGKADVDGWYQPHDINVVYSVSQNNTSGWYLNDKKNINLDDIGISISGTPDDTWNGEGFTQERVSKIPTAQNLMPSLYRNSIGERKFYNAINYPRSAGSNDQDGASGETLNGLMYENDNYKENGSYYNFETLWTQNNQNEHIQDFEEIYPSITNVTNANNEPIDEILEVAFDDNDNNEVDEEGNYIHRYFYVRIPKFDGNNGFNLFDHKIVGGNMQVAMTSGDCAACNFEIMVKTRPSQGNDTYEDVVNPIKLNDDGTLVEGDSDKKTAGDFGSEDATQQDSRNNSIWLVLQKDNQTFNETYPNYAKGVFPKVGDKFVLLNIDMPRSYVLEAEEKLTKEIIKYMSENNSDKWNFDIDFSRIFLQENQNFYSRLDENCKLYVKYNGLIYNFYVNNYKYEVKANEALPKITVGLVDTITVNRGVTQNIVDGVMEAIYQTYDVEEGLDYDALYFRKTVPETITHKTTFDADVDINGNLNVEEIKLKKLQSPMYGGDEVMGSGFQLEEDENGNSTLTVDNINVRKKLKATEFVIQQIQFQGGIVIQSAAAMECNQVEKLENGNFKCYFDTKEGSVSNQFVKNDLARCQRVGYAPKYYWRKVVEVGSNYIVLSNVTGEYEQNSDTPSEGDIIVQMGNTTNTDRQSAIEMNTVGENSPSFIMYSGINSFSLVGKDVTGIVYHQKVFDANGNVSIEAYPELYSYGSMYFGDRNKQNNFIQFAPNTNGTFEMLINAKTSFNGSTSDLGTALDGLLSGVQGAQEGAQEAKELIAQEEQKRTQAIADVVGGISNLQQQVDGEVNSWFMEGAPTLSNAPANEWTTDELKQRHEGDTYTDISEITLLGSWLWEQGGYIGSTGNAYESLTNIRTKDFIENKGGVLFVPSGYQIGILYYNSNNEWQKVVWVTKNTQLDTNYPKFKLNFSSSSSNSTTPILPSIADELKFSINPTSGQSWRFCNCSYTTEDGMDIYGWHWHKIADSDAVKALAEAGKAQATADGKSTTFVVQPTNYDKGDLWILQSDTDHSEGKKGDILTANEASVTYVASHWSKQVKYTDDTLVNSIKYGGLNLIGRVSMKEQNTSYFINTVATEKLFEEEVRQVTKVAGGTPPIVALYPINDKIKAGVPYVASVYIKNSSDVASNDQYFARIIFRNVSKGSNITDGQVTEKCNNWSQIYTTYTFEEQDLDDNIGIYVYTNTGATGTTYASCLKLQEGNRPTEGFEATNTDIAEVEKEALEVSSALATTQNTLAQSLEDGYLSKDEQVRLKGVLDALNGEFNELTKEYEDVVDSKFLTSKGNLESAYGSLQSAHTSYVEAIQKLLDIKIGAYKIPINPTGYWDWETEFNSYVEVYYECLPTLVNALSQAQSDIQANIEAKAQEYTNQAVNDIQVGGVNLVPFNDIMLWNGTQIRNRPTITITANSSYQGGVYIPASYIQLNTEYVLSFKIKKTSGSITKIGGHHGTGTSEVYIDGVKMPNAWNSSNTIADDTNEHYIVVKFKQTTSASDNKLYIQLNRTNYTTAYTCVISEIQLEVGNKATSYKPNEADRIEARENLLKDVMVFDRPIASNNTTYTRIYTSEALKPNTEYVFSIESIVLKTGSATPTDISIMFWTSGANNAPINISYSAKKMSAVVTTPSHVNANTQFFLYAGKFQATQGVGYMAFGVKLAEGNVYTGWEATPSEQQALIAVSKAMKGSTDIIGGLMLTNLIGMRNTNNQIKAGISGLEENNNLRFWAGSTAWENANTAPFRVYDNGTVHAGNFYGFNGAFVINNDNIASLITIVTTDYDIYFKIDFQRTGSYIYVDDISSFIAQKEAEYGKDFWCFVLPTDIIYVGVSLEILNPYGYMFYECSETPLKRQCDLSNFSQTFTEGSIDNVASAIFSHENINGKQYYRWSIIPSICSPMVDNYIRLQAIATKTPANIKYTTELHKWKVKGTSTIFIPIDSSEAYYKTTSDCIFMRWIIAERSNEEN